MMNCTYNNFSFLNPLQPTIHPTAPRPVEQNNVMFPMLQSSPPFYHFSGASFSVTFVDQMTVDQTANWIRTLGWYNGWAEVEAYAERFRENSVSGMLLQKLTAEILEFSLGIVNLGHRLELLSAIEHLFPSTTVGAAGLLSPRSCVAPELISYVTGSENRENMYDNMRQMLQSDSASTISNLQMDCSDMTSESGFSKRSMGLAQTWNGHHLEDEGLSIPMMNGARKAMPAKNPGKMEVTMAEKAAAVGSLLKHRTLYITLRPDQIFQEK